MTEFPDAPIVAKRTPYQHRSINNNSLTIPWARTSAYQHSFFPNALGLWNGLPEDMTSINNLMSFKKLLLFRGGTEVIKVIRH